MLASRIIGFAFCLALVYVVLACETLPYTSFANPETVGLFLEDTAQVAVVSFSASPDMFHQGSGGPLEAVGDAISGKTFAQTLAERDLVRSLMAGHHSGLVNALSNNLNLTKTAPPLVEERYWELLTKQQIAERIEDAEADFGIVVRDRYGWRSGLPLVPGVSRTASIDQYAFLSCAGVYSSTGDEVWRFCGCGIVRPDETPVQSFAIIFEWYPRMLLEMIKETANGVSHKHSIQSYFPSVSDRDLYIVDATSSRSHLCSVYSPGDLMPTVQSS